ncbi:MAG: thermonuclease family protein [Bacteroidetes bacterium]|nr:thermonuclease family protein [Bacteroidota bacterium]
MGIDTPEIRGSERAKGLLARNKLRELILDKEVIILSKKAKKGKYGRWLGTIFTSKE